MPVTRCQKDGVAGWKWGISGTCYTGSGAREKALAQGRAIAAEAKAAYKGGKKKPRRKDDRDFQQIKKFDEELRIAWAEVYVPNVPDTQGDFMSVDEVRKMAHGFLANGLTKSVDLEHDEKTDYGCAVVESFVARDNDPDFEPGAWVAGVHIPGDDLWAAVKSGEINGFSFMGRGYHEERKVELEVPDRVTGETDVADGHTHTFSATFDERGNFLGGSTNLVDGHKHEILRATITESADGHSHRFTLTGVRVVA